MCHTFILYTCGMWREKKKRNENAFGKFQIKSRFCFFFWKYFVHYIKSHIERKYLWNIFFSKENDAICFGYLQRASVVVGRLFLNKFYIMFFFVINKLPASTRAYWAIHCHDASGKTKRRNFTVCPCFGFCAQEQNHVDKPSDHIMAWLLMAVIVWSIIVDWHCADIMFQMECTKTLRSMLQLNCAFF